MMSPINSSKCIRGHVRFGLGSHGHFSRYLSSKGSSGCFLRPGLKVKCLEKEVFSCNPKYFSMQWPFLWISIVGSETCNENKI